MGPAAARIVSLRIIAVAGAIDFDSLKEAVARLFGDWEPKPEASFDLRQTGPSRDHLLKETQQTQIALAYPTVTVDNPDYYQARAMIGIIIKKRPINMARPIVVLYQGVLALSPAKALPLLPLAELKA